MEFKFQHFNTGMFGIKKIVAYSKLEQKIVFTHIWHDWYFKKCTDVYVEKSLEKY